MSLRAKRQKAAHLSWASTPDRSARSAAGQRGLEARFVRLARERHPDATEAQITATAASLRKAHFADLNARSHAARQRRAS